MGRQAIRAVLLDALGTLVSLQPPAPRLREELRRRTGVEVGLERAAAAFAAEIAFYLGHHLEARDAASLERLRDRCAEVLAAALGEPRLSAREVRPAMLAALRFTAFPDAAPALAGLRARGLRLVVASNWDPSLPEVLAAAGLGAHLDAVVTSGTVGAAKPDRRLFTAALAAAGVGAEAAVHVGDSLENDVAGARTAGIRPVFLARAGASGREVPPGVAVVRSLGEVASVLFEGS